MIVPKRMKFADRIHLIAGEVDACWLWPLSRATHGYGQVRIGGKTMRAHRAAYELLIGPVPEGLELDHLCRNRACVNPAHLAPVTHQINLLRGVGFAAAHAVKTHCPHGHAYNAHNTYIDKKGQRHCRACKRTRMAERYRRNAKRRSASLIEYDL